MVLCMKSIRFKFTFYIIVLLLVNCGKKDIDIFKVQPVNKVISSETILQKLNKIENREAAEEYISYRNKLLTLSEIFYPADKDIYGKIISDIAKNDEDLLKSADNYEAVSDVSKNIEGIYREYLNELDKPLKLISDYLDHFPPYEDNYENRLYILLLFDKIVHLEHDISKNSDLRDFLNYRMKKTVEEIRVIRPKEEVAVWKIYNHGFIVRDNTLTIAFDVVRGAEDIIIEDEYINVIAENIDVLFISHIHSDHNDIDIAEKVLQAGGAVVIPENLWKNINADFKYAVRSRSKPDSVFINKKNRYVKFFTFPGHQGELINNVYAVELPVKKQVMHTGDQSSGNDIEWLKNISEQIRIDILIPNCWTNDLAGLTGGLAPSAVILGHENEMGHTVDHRESFEQSYQLLEKISSGKIILNWGEKYIYFLSKKLM